MKITITIPETELCNAATWYRVEAIIQKAMREIKEITPEDCYPSVKSEKRD